MVFTTSIPSFGSTRRRVSNVLLNLAWKARAPSLPDLLLPTQNELKPIYASLNRPFRRQSFAWLVRLHHRISQPVVPSFRMQHIPIALTRHVVESREMQMHSRHEQPVGRDLIEYLLARLSRLLIVHVEVRSGIG